jgi:hypothetical protein
MLSGLVILCPLAYCVLLDKTACVTNGTAGEGEGPARQFNSSCSEELRMFGCIR